MKEFFQFFNFRFIFLFLYTFIIAQKFFFIFNVNNIQQLLVH